MSAPLFALPPGPMRVAFDALADGAPEPLRLLGGMQADRLDEMRARGNYRGLVPLSAEFRATLRDLSEAGAGPADPLEDLLREWREQGRAAGDPTAAGNAAG